MEPVTEKALLYFILKNSRELITSDDSKKYFGELTKELRDLIGDNYQPVIESKKQFTITDKYYSRDKYSRIIDYTAPLDSEKSTTLDKGTDYVTTAPDISGYTYVGYRINNGPLVVASMRDDREVRISTVNADSDIYFLYEMAEVVAKPSYSVSYATEGLDKNLLPRPYEVGSTVIVEAAEEFIVESTGDPIVGWTAEIDGEWKEFRQVLPDKGSFVMPAHDVKFEPIFI